MPRCFIDHITVTAPSLETGAQLVRQSLGVTPQAGGEHARMATHNLLLRLGESVFLEVIAPNPNVPPPGRPRWFALDDLRPDSPPALRAWVARTPDIRASVAACPEALGTIETMRRGLLEWLITIPADGVLPLSGAGPALIEWQIGGHPAAGLKDLGLSLHRLELFHPEPERIYALLRSVGIEGPIGVFLPTGENTPAMVAHINTPQGMCWLPDRAGVR